MQFAILKQRQHVHVFRGAHHEFQGDQRGASAHHQVHSGPFPGHHQIAQKAHRFTKSVLINSSHNAILNTHIEIFK